MSYLYQLNKTKALLCGDSSDASSSLNIMCSGDTSSIIASTSSSDKSEGIGAKTIPSISQASAILI